jgi:hypothetical protein
MGRLLHNRKADIGWDPRIVKLVDQFATRTPSGYRWFANCPAGLQSRSYTLHNVTGDAVFVVQRRPGARTWVSERLVRVSGRPWPQELGPYDTEGEAISRANAQFEW